MLTKFSLSGYRCYPTKTTIIFRPGINLIAGENDAGKTTILTALSYFTPFSSPITAEDFSYLDSTGKTTDRIELELEIDSVTMYKVVAVKSGETTYYENINGEEIKEKLVNFTLEDAKKRAKKLGGTGRSSQLSSLLTEIVDKLPRGKKRLPIKKEDIQLNIGYFDGKANQDVNSSFKDFLQGEVNTLRSQPFEHNGQHTTLQEIVDRELDIIKNRKSHEYRERLVPKIQQFLPQISDITIDISSNLKEFKSYTTSIKLKDAHGKEILLKNKGDGTQRRANMALFQAQYQASSGMVYLLDEPDTHLHVRAQQDLFSFFEHLATNDNQIIFTSHSPFFLNLIPIRNITIITQRDGVSTPHMLSGENLSEYEHTLACLGIQNLDLFFSKYFLFVEGETEEVFFTELFHHHNISLQKKFIKLVNRQGITNIASFVKTFSQLATGYHRIFVLVDGDYEDNTQTKTVFTHLSSLSYVSFHPLGEREFEDLFDPHEIYECFSEYISDKETFLNGALNSPKISRYYEEQIHLTKPQIAKKLANYYITYNLPLPLSLSRILSILGDL